MADHEAVRGTVQGGLAVSPGLSPALEAVQTPVRAMLVDRRVLLICGLAIGLGLTAGLVSQVLVALIRFFTNLSFYGRLSAEAVSPADNHLGLWVIVVPIVGALVVGVMARYGSAAIRGHGIPEAMEQVLVNQSRIPARITFLKPLSAAISIGTGGPFGAEGPIIATGGALGSLIGQLLHTTPDERKSLLAAGAGAGMAATFGSPVSAVLLAVELLLFEFRPRSLVPVALASTAAAGTRLWFEGAEPVFALPNLAPPSGMALMFYVAMGALIGVAAVLVTKIVYAVEDVFDHLPIHWMWWPALGAVAVGVCGYFAPRTLGVGYDNISDILSARLTLEAIIFLCAMKFISWSISLGSGTSGGTLAPLFTIGGGLGTAIGYGAAWLMPSAGIDPRIAALVGMAGIFAGASRAVLASVVFAFETTLQPLGLLPLLGGCTAAYLVSCVMMRNTIMTEKIARRGVRAPNEYSADALDQILVRDVASQSAVTLHANDLLASVRLWFDSRVPGSSHQGFPVIDADGHLRGVVTRKDLLSPTLTGAERIDSLIRRPPIIVYDDCTVREAVDHMVNHDVGRLPVISREDHRTLVGIITRSDVMLSYRRGIEESGRVEKGINLRFKKNHQKTHS